jgi:hypothetical protein
VDHASRQTDLADFGVRPDDGEANGGTDDGGRRLALAFPDDVEWGGDADPTVTTRVGGGVDADAERLRTVRR